MSAPNSATMPRGTVISYVLGAGQLLLVAVVLRAGQPWYAVGLVGTAMVCLLGARGRRVFRAAVFRQDEAIVCRYLPLWESYFYIWVVAFPLIGVFGWVIGGQPGGPVWLRLFGPIGIGFGVVMAMAGLWGWLRCRLVITAEALAVRFGGRSGQFIDVPRGDVRSIELRPRPSSFTTGKRETLVYVVYHPAGADPETTKGLTLGLNFTVPTVNLYAALRIWNEADGRDPALMDTLEAVLRGRDVG